MPTSQHAALWRLAIVSFPSKHSTAMQYSTRHGRQQATVAAHGPSRCTSGHSTRKHSASMECPAFKSHSNTIPLLLYILVHACRSSRHVRVGDDAVDFLKIHMLPVSPGACSSSSGHMRETLHARRLNGPRVPLTSSQQGRESPCFLHFSSPMCYSATGWEA